MWIKRRNAKNLVRRSRLKDYLKQRNFFYYSPLNLNTSYKSYNSSNKRYEFQVPCNFSFLNNTEETIGFFNEMIQLINQNRKNQFEIFIDIKNVENLTIDALMYLLSIINNMKNVFKRRISIKGNTPLDSNINLLFKESGFFNYVKSTNIIPIYKNSNTIQIISGKDADTVIARRISDFVSEKLGMTRSQCSFIYVMMIELMSNTYKHAYANNTMNKICNKWYCFCKYDHTEQIVSFTFMDVGAGIPTTVRKKFAEKLDFLKLKAENRYVISALEGQFRTSTSLAYRGKGLPRIHETCQSRKIRNMRIITNKADVSDDGDVIKGCELSKPLRGTLYYCELRRENIG